MAKAIEFKQTEIGEIPADWGIGLLGDADVAIIIMGQSPVSSSYNDSKNGLPFYQGKTDFGLKYPIPTQWCSDPAKVAVKGDILLSVRAPVGDVNIATEQCCIGRGITALRAGSKSNGEYLFYAMLFSKARLNSLGSGAIFKAVNKETLVSFKIPWPPKPEQERIGWVLSKIQKALENQERIVADLRELKAVTTAKLFHEGLRGEPLKQTEIGEIPKSWAAVPLSSVCIETKTLNPAKTPDKVIEYVDVSSISREECRIVSSTKYLGKDAPGRARNLVQHGDAIFATVRPTLRRVAIVPQELDGQLVSTAFCVIRAIEQKAHPEYLFYMVSSADFIARVGRLERGANYPAVTNGNVLAQIIALPEYEEQKEIAAAIGVIDKSLNMAVKIHAELRVLFSSTLVQLLTGEVRIPD